MSDVCLCARIVIPGAGLPFDSSVFPSAAPGRSDRWVWRSKAAGSRSGMLVKEAGRRRSCGTEAIRWGVNPAGPHVCGVKIIALFVQWLTEKMRQAASRNSIQPRLILILHGYSSPVQVSAAFPETNFRICLQVTDLRYRVRLSTVAAVRRTQTQPLRNLQLLCSVWWGGTFTRFRGMLRRERGSALRVEAAHNVV